jgi:hypothetical protein
MNLSLRCSLQPIVLADRFALLNAARISAKSTTPDPEVVEIGLAALALVDGHATFLRVVLKASRSANS